VTFDYEFSVWPVEYDAPSPSSWALFETFKFVPRMQMTRTEDEFQAYRVAMNKCGFSLREISRVPHHEPETVL